jgi:hypothetical protein
VAIHFDANRLKCKTIVRAILGTVVHLGKFPPPNVRTPPPAGLNGSQNRPARIKALALYCDPVYFVVQSISASRMTGLPKALAEINAIRGQVARGTEFSGYDPASIALSGVLALFVATIQSYWVRNSLYDFSMCVVIWVAIAAVSVTSVSRRSRDAFILASLRR